MDPALWELLRDEEAAGDRVVEAIIRLRRPGLEIPGVRIVSRFGRIATCRLAASSVLEVREHADVVSLKAPRSLGPEYETFPADGHAGSASDLGLADCRRPSDLPLTGAGVVVGVVDWGLDFDHPNFKAPDGSTRLLALWDQRNNTTGASPQPYGYGTVHEQEQINQALQSLEPYRHLGYHPAAADRGGGSHGTHVMDIAAGNGRVGGPTGVAPNAKLVFVHLADRDTGGLANLGDSVRLLEAVDFIARTARDRPWVINFSVGRHGGPHDGTTLMELALDEFVSAAPGRFTVHSTGNYRRSRAHACGMLKQGQARTLSFVTDPADTTANELEIWYDGDDEFAVCINPPETSGAEAVPLGSQAELAVDEQVVGRVYHRAHDPNNDDNHIDAFLLPWGRAGIWTVTIEAVHVRSGRFHAWLERDEACKPCQARFIPDDSNSTYTTGTIANSHVPLVVGGYDAHSRTRPVAAFSSSGPTRDNRQKPDLVAPGVGVLAARSAPPGSVRSRGQLVRKSGSSMAAPHVTGAVALCLQAGGQRLDAQRIRALVLGTTDPNTRTDSGFRLGRGYLNIPELVVAVQRAFPTIPVGDTKESAMDSDLGATVPFAIAPSQAYRELLYRPDGQLSHWIDTRFDIIARPGQRVSDPPQPGDIMLQVTLGQRGAGTCFILVDPILTREHASGPHGSPGWYAAARDAAASMNPRQRRILDPSGYLPPGRLLLRPRTIGTVDGVATNHKLGGDDTEERTPVPMNVSDVAATEMEQAATATFSDSEENLPEVDEYLDQLGRAGDETEGEGQEPARFSAEVDSGTGFEALSDLEGQDWLPAEADAAEVSWPVKSKVVKGLLAAAKEWKLPLTEAGAEAIADEMSLGQASKLGEDAPADKAAAEKLAAEKLAILRQITQSVIAKTKDQKLKKELQDLVAAVDKAASSPRGTSSTDEASVDEASDAESALDKAKDTIRAQAKRLGTDEAAILSALRALSPSEMAELSADPTVVDALRDELSGTDLSAAGAQLARGRVGSMARVDIDRILASPARYSFGTLAAAIARDILLGHQEAFDRTGTGTIHGSHCAAPTPAGTTRSDCTEYVKDVLKRTFAAKGQAGVWTDVLKEATTRSGATGLKGTSVIKALQTKQNWEALFWSPDPLDPADGQAEHPYAYKIVREKGTYYGITVDQSKSVINYRRTNAANRTDLSGIERLRRLQFGVLAARGGMHMALVVNGAVYEVHWSSPATDRNAIAATPLESFVWQSGTIAAPPGDLALAWRMP